MRHSWWRALNVSAPSARCSAMMRFVGNKLWPFSSLLARRRSSLPDDFLGGGGGFGSFLAEVNLIIREVGMRLRVPFAPRRVIIMVLGLAALALGFLAGSSSLEASLGARSDGSASSSPPIACPTATSVAAKFDADLSPTHKDLGATAILEIEMRGVDPANPDAHLRGLGINGATSRALARCFMAYSFDPESINWTDGVIKARFNIPLYVYSKDQSYGSEMFSATIGLRTAADLTIDMCPGADYYRFDDSVVINDQPGYRPYLCRSGAKFDISVHIADFRPSDDRKVPSVGGRPDAPATVTTGSYASCACLADANPFPQETVVSDEKTTYQWAYTGPPPTVHAAVDVPFRWRAGMIAAHQTFRWSAGPIEIGYLSLAAAGLVALLTAAIFGRRRATWLRVLGICLGFAAMTTVQVFNPPLLSVFMTIPPILGWVVLVLALNRFKRRWTYVMSGVAASAIFAVLVANIARWFAETKKVRGSSPTYATGRYYYNPYSSGISTAAPEPASWVAYVDNGIAVLAIVVIIVAILVILRWATAVFGLASADYPAQNGLSSRDIKFLMYSIGVVGLDGAAGYVIGRSTRDEPYSGMSSIGRYVAYNAQYAAVPVVIKCLPLVALSFVTYMLIYRLKGSSQTDWMGVSLLAALALSLAAPWSENGTIPFIVNVPLWPVQFLVLALAFRTLCRRPILSHAQCDPAALLQAIRRAAADKAVTSDTALQRVTLLEHGRHNDVLLNARVAGRAAALISVVPVTYFVWSTLVSGGWQSWGWASFFVIISLVAESLRWVVSGFAFGLLYRRLPGQSGPVKAMWFSAFWFTGSICAVAVARTAGVDGLQDAIYRGLQYFVLMIAVAVAMDLQAIKAAGGTWRDLQATYALTNYVEVVVAVTPVLLLVVGLVQQIAAGSGLDVAETLITGVNDIVTSSVGGVPKPAGPPS